MENLQNIDDQELFLLIQQDDYKAYEELYNRYWKRLYVTAVKKTGCNEDAMDLVQELFIEFWEKRARTIITISFSAYLISSLYYKIFHYFRHKGIAQRHIRNFLEFSELNSETMFQLDSISQQETVQEFEHLQRIIDQAIEDMPERMRQVFQMTRTGDHSVSEIAEALNISSQTVKNHTGNAMQRLRKVVQKQVLEMPAGMLLILLINK